MHPAVISGLLVFLEAVGIVAQGCSETDGFIKLDSSQECFKYIDKRVSWEEANRVCEEEGLVMALPDKTSAVILRKILLDKYGIGGVHRNMWMDGRYNGSISGYVAQHEQHRNVSPLMPGDDLWYPGHPAPFVTPGHCLSLAVSEQGLRVQPAKPYYPVPCDYRYYALCQGCKDGIIIPGSTECFKLFRNERLTWLQAASLCKDNKLTLAKPSTQITLLLRKYLYDTYGEGDVWLNAIGNGASFVWQEDGTELRNDDELWWTGSPVNILSPDPTDYCLQLLVNEDNWKQRPSTPYATHPCSSTRYILCQDSGTKAPVAVEVPGPDISTKPSSDVTNQDEAACGLSSSFDERIAIGNVNINEKITGGQETIAGKYPWMVHLSFYSSFFDVILNCGGSLVSKRWVLTAAHCIRHLKQNIDVYVRIGYVNLKQQEPESELFSVHLDHIITHKQFSESTLQNDIALVRLPQDVKFNTAIRPICLANKHMIPFGGKAIAAGWGLLDSGDTEIPNVLREVQLDVLEENSCENPQNFICTSTTGKDTCKGDSGGPLMVKHGHQWFLIGIVSHGPTNCGSSNLPGVYTRVPNYIPFITSYINL